MAVLHAAKRSSEGRQASGGHAEPPRESLAVRLALWRPLRHTTVYTVLLAEDPAGPRIHTDLAVLVSEEDPACPWIHVDLAVFVAESHPAGPRIHTGLTVLKADDPAGAWIHLGDAADVVEHQRPHRGKNVMGP